MPVLRKVLDRNLGAHAAEHMLSLVEGGIKYLTTLCTAFDESTRRLMVKTFNDARKQLGGRLLVEGQAHVGSGRSTRSHVHG